MPHSIEIPTVAYTRKPRVKYGSHSSQPCGAFHAVPSRMRPITEATSVIRQRIKNVLLMRRNHRFLITNFALLLS
jgi:hypothetical protein